MIARTYLPAPLLILALCACNTGSGQEGTSTGVSAGPAFGDFLIKDIAADDLFSFRAVVTSLELVRDDGSRTASVLESPVSLDLLGLREEADWLAAIQFPSGTYTGLVLGFSPMGFAATDLAGDPVEVIAAALELAVDLAGPMDVARGSYARFVVDVDLEASLTGAVSDGQVVFDPVGTADVSDGSEPLAVDELDARVLLRDTGSLALSVEGFADGEHTRSLGSFDIVVDGATVLVDPQGTLFDQTSFFYTLLVPGLTVIELHGTLGLGGVFLAERLEIESQDGRPGSLFPVKLEGTLIERGAGALLIVRLRSIERGREVFEPILEAQDDPRTISLSPDARTLSFDELGLLDAEALPLGGELELKLEIAPGSPFPVLRFGLAGMDDRFLTEGP